MYLNIKISHKKRTKNLLRQNACIHNSSFESNAFIIVQIVLNDVYRPLGH